jgi:hypothetical protein
MEWLGLLAVSNLPENIDFLVAAQEIQSANVDREVFISTLANSLRSTLPKQTKVQKAGMFSRNVRAIAVTGPNDQLTIEIDRFGHLRCFKRPFVNGIGLEAVSLDLAAWLSTLAVSTRADADMRNAVNDALQKGLL